MGSHTGLKIHSFFFGQSGAVETYEVNDTAFSLALSSHGRVKKTGDYIELEIGAGDARVKIDVSLHHSVNKFFIESNYWNKFIPYIFMKWMKLSEEVQLLCEKGLLLCGLQIPSIVFLLCLVPTLHSSTSQLKFSFLFTWIDWVVIGFSVKSIESLKHELKMFKFYN